MEDTLHKSEDFDDSLERCGVHGGRYQKDNFLALKKHGNFEFQHPGLTGTPEAYSLSTTCLCNDPEADVCVDAKSQTTKCSVPQAVNLLLMHLTFVEAACSHSSTTSSLSSILAGYSISLSLDQKLELLGWKDVAMLSGRELELLVGLAEGIMAGSKDKTVAEHLIKRLPNQAQWMV
eukprot:1146838-Pelagomonas_calceolata.AAC.2